MEEDDTSREKAGVVVPIPTLPRKKDALVVVAMRLPTVNCVPVAMRLPEELTVTMEFGEKPEEPVPPLTVGRMPVTCVVREI